MRRPLFLNGIKAFEAVLKPATQRNIHLDIVKGYR
jgi:hypothetical protein